MAVRVEELGLAQGEPAIGIRQAYEAFMSGNPYCLPTAYVNYPGRNIVGSDTKYKRGFPIIINPISERIFSFGDKGRFQTVLYIPGEHTEGYTFVNPDRPWSNRAEALVLREVRIGEGGGVRVRSIAEVPRSLAGEDVFNLGMMYRAAVGKKDLKGRAEIGTVLRKQYGLQFRMDGSNGPEYWLWGY